VKKNIFVDEGNLGADPMLKIVPVKTPNGVEQRSVLELQVRFDVSKKKGNSYEDIGGFWAKVEQWGKRAEFNHAFLKKGCRVLVVGKLSQHPYIVQKGERQGQAATATEIEASNIALVLLGVEAITFQEKSPRTDEPADDDEADSFDDDLPI